MVTSLKIVYPQKIGCADDCGFRAVIVVLTTEKGVPALNKFIANCDILLVGDTGGHNTLIEAASKANWLGMLFPDEQDALKYVHEFGSRKSQVSGNLDNGKVVGWSSVGYRLTTPEDIRPAVENLLSAVIRSM